MAHRDISFFLFPRFTKPSFLGVRSVSVVQLTQNINLYTAEKTFPPRIKRFHCGENVSPAEKTFPPRWKPVMKI